MQPTDHHDDPARAAWRLTGWGLVAVGVALVHNRLWAAPNLGAFAEIAAELGSDPFGADSSSDYLLSNLSLPALARLTGQTEPQQYAALHLVVLLVGLVACIVLAFWHHGYRTARTLTVLLAAAPGVTVSMQWLGQPDALTFPLGVATVLVRRRSVFVGLAVLLGTTHPEQAVFVVAVAAVVRAWVLPEPVSGPLSDRVRGLVPELAVGLGGVVAGRLLTEVYLRVFDIGVARPRSDYLRLGTELMVEHHGRAPWSLLYLLWGPLWLVVGAVIVLRIRGRGDDRGMARSWAVLGLLALLALVPVAITLDETRVYAMITAPVLGAAAVLLTREMSNRGAVGERMLVGASAALVVVTLVVPGGFTAGEDAWATEIPAGDFVDYLRTGEPPSEPIFLWLLSPFDFVFPDVADS
jgi:hypothetical protein